MDYDRLMIIYRYGLLPTAKKTYTTVDEIKKRQTSNNEFEQQHLDQRLSTRFQFSLQERLHNNIIYII